MLLKKRDRLLLRGDPRRLTMDLPMGRLRDLEPGT
jgi:hypothetical protein